METFGIWNLLKSILSNETQVNSSQASHRESAPSEGKSETEKPIENAPPSPPESKTNACEEYFLRHEQLKNGRKR